MNCAHGCAAGHTLWLWVAVDPLSKIIPVLHLGARTQAAAHTVKHDLYRRLIPGCLPVFTSDGLNHYFYALTAHFGTGSQAWGAGHASGGSPPGCCTAR